MERTDLPLRRLFAVLLVLPIAVPEYVNGAGWVSLCPACTASGAAVLVMTLSHYPLVYLPAAAVLRGGDPALEEIVAQPRAGAVAHVLPGDAAPAAPRRCSAAAW